MTHQLIKVVENLKQLSTKEQNAIASLIQDELLWESKLKKSEKQLSNLAQEALKEHYACKTKKGRL